jgi:GNAT superfamily N-acetyltransferase
VSGGPAYTVGLVDAADLPRLAELMARSTLLARYRVSGDGALASLREAQQAGDVLLAGRAAEAAISGFAWLVLAPRVLGGAAYVRLLLVEEAAQGSGLGSRLLEAAEAIARQDGRTKHLYLLVTVDNHGARRFYARHGYRHVGDLPGLVWPDLDEALYHKALGRA